MNTRNDPQYAARVTVETLEKLIGMDEQRRKELLAEIAALRLRERVIGASEDSSWVAMRFIEPRLAELRAVDARIALVRQKLTEFMASLAKPAPAPVAAPASAPVAAPAPRPAPAHVWVETHQPGMIALAA